MVESSEVQLDSSAIAARSRAASPLVTLPLYAQLSA